MNANPLMDDDADEGEDSLDSTVRRKAREILARTEPTYEEKQEQEERRQRIRDAEIDAEIQQRQAPNYQQRKAPILAGDYEARQQANQLARMVEALPAPPRKTAVERLERDLRRYRVNLEKAIGIVVGRLQTRHDSAEQRIVALEARLAQSEQRIASLESKPVIEHEKQPGQ